MGSRQPGQAAGTRGIPLIAVVVMIAGATGASPATAQEPRYFVTGGMSRDINSGFFPAMGGGALWEVPDSWVFVGVRGDVFFSNGYAAGRAGPIAQVALVRRRAVRPFVMTGFGWGEDAGPMLGAGIEVWPRDRLGIRVSVQDYVADVSTAALHQPNPN